MAGVEDLDSGLESMNEGSKDLTPEKITAQLVESLDDDLDEVTVFLSKHAFIWLALTVPVIE